MENLKSNQMEKLNNASGKESDMKENHDKPKSAGNKSFRKHNKTGFYRLMQRKKKKRSNLRDEKSAQPLDD